MSEFENVLDSIENCQTRYKNEFISYMQQISAEAGQSIVVSAYCILYSNIEFYTRRNLAHELEIEQAKEYFKVNIKDCKEFNIDYQSLLPTEVQRFYDLNPIQQTAISCDKAKANILNIVLQEIVKLYNLYQQAPQAKREISDIKIEIEACKENNIDYKKVLTPEMLKFFGVE